MLHGDILSGDELGERRKCHSQGQGGRRGVFNPFCPLSNGYKDKLLTARVSSGCFSITKGLVTNYGEGGGGLKTGRGGACEVLPLRKGGAQKVLAILKGGAQKVSTLEKGAQKVLPCLGGGRKKFQTRDFPIF